MGSTPSLPAPLTLTDFTPGDLVDYWLGDRWLLCRVQSVTSQRVNVRPIYDPAHPLVTLNLRRVTPKHLRHHKEKA